MYEFKTAKQLFESVVPISRFNKGEAGKIIEEVKKDGVKIVVKNNKPVCVLLSVETYDELIRKANHECYSNSAD